MQKVREILLTCFPSLRDQNPALPFGQCLKTVASYILSSFIVIYIGRESSVQLFLVEDGVLSLGDLKKNNLAIFFFSTPAISLTATYYIEYSDIQTMNIKWFLER